MITGEIAVTGLDSAFFPSSSQTHHGLLVTWGHWDNSLVVRSVGAEPSTLKLHHPPLNRVSRCGLVLSNHTPLLVCVRTRLCSCNECVSKAKFYLAGSIYGNEDTV